jgi:hypothetical protein
MGVDEMRDKEEIMGELNKVYARCPEDTESAVDMCGIYVELLVDIRDIMYEFQVILGRLADKC